MKRMPADLPEWDISLYDYHLPYELIALEKRNKGESKMLVLDRKDKSLSDGFVGDICSYLDKDVVVVFNNTKVIPARLIGRKETGGKVDLVLMNPMDSGRRIWKALVKKHRLRVGGRVFFEKRGDVVEAIYRGEGVFEFERSLDIDLLDKIGFMPIPPYIKRDPVDEDKKMYQTVFAKEYGSIAAPTAGLHFTDELIEKIRRKAADLIYVTLHVGWGTFAPVKSLDIRKHKIHKEIFSVESDAILRLRRAKGEGKRILAVGTTSVRVLETISDWILDERKQINRIESETDLFIYPGYEFKVVDILFTNFHLPKSSLLLLVCAFAGREFVLNAYKYAISKGYHFYSYGDAMLIL